VKKVLKSVNIWHSYEQKGALCRALSSTFISVAARARYNHFLACNFAKYSPILIFFTGKLANKPFLI